VNGYHTMHDHLLVFVPGILGTELYYHGEGPNKNLIRRPVWSQEFTTLWDTLAKNPNILADSVSLEVGPPLEYVRVMGGLRKIPVYGPLLKFLISKDYSEESNLLLFGYDWRQSNSHSAGILATRIREKMKLFALDKIKFISHSMGGIVVRLLLSHEMNQDIATRTSSFIQIGTPVRGSSKAFYTLKKRPDFSGLFQQLSNLNWHLNIEIYKRLMDAMESFNSLFELLPHETEKILVTSSDDHFSAVDAGCWPALNSQRLDRIKGVHASVATFESPNTVAVYSSETPTPRDYIIDNGFEILREAYVVDGDGTVSVASASLGTKLEQRRLVPGDVGHDDLPSNSQVWRYISAELEK
jgi:pimeloyl-ACP methyl ester carboxylesterase